MNTVEIHLPPLRDRREDIEPLGMHALARLVKKYCKPIQGLDTGAMTLLHQHPWPGNIRELNHAMERAVLLCETGQIRPSDLELTKAQLETDRYTQEATVAALEVDLEQARLESSASDQLATICKRYNGPATRSIGRQHRRQYRRRNRARIL